MFMEIVSVSQKKTLWMYGWVKISVKHSDQHRVSEAIPSTVAQSWPCGSQMPDKKTKPVVSAAVWGIVCLNHQVIVLKDY